MTIAYVANIRLPTEKAHGYQIMRVCSALAAAGGDVTLYVPRRRNHLTEDPFTYYGIERNFSVVFVPTFDWIRFSSVLGPLAFFLESFGFLWSLPGQLARGTIVYTRNAEAVWYLARRGFTSFYSAHNWSGSALTRRFLKNAAGVVANSRGTKEAVEAATGLPATVIPNASDPNPYAGADKATLRRELGLPQGAYLVLYSGHLYDWKGSNTLFAAACALAASKQIRFACIGGTAEDVARAKREVSTNVDVLGHQKKELVPKFLAAADLLLLPNEKTSEESARFTSPLKLFEYMASGTPILASDLPSLREILSDEMALFAEAGDPASFAERVAWAAANPKAALALAEAALQASSRYTWDAHAQRLIGLFKPI